MSAMPAMPERAPGTGAPGSANSRSDSIMSHTPSPLASMRPEPEHGPLTFSHDYARRLRQLVHAPEHLTKAGYVVRQLSSKELERKKRCASCSKVLKTRDKFRDTTQATAQATSSARRNGPESQHSQPRMGRLAKDSSGTVSGTRDGTNEHQAGQDVLPGKGQAANPRCTFHSGRVAYRKWTCCNGSIMTKPCTSRENHTPREYGPGELESNWKFFATPHVPPHARRAAAVVIDCEMGNADSGESELIRVSVVDFFTRQVLLDSLVSPRVKMAHYNTRFSGITRQMMENARRRRTCLDGREGAREAIWRFVGPETIVVGHGAQSDLTSLRWIHTSIIDTLMVEMGRRREERMAAEAENALHMGEEDPKGEDDDDIPETGDGSEQKTTSPRAEGGLSLKSLALDRLKRVIQVKGQGHDSVEDAIATRDLLCWHVSHMMQASDALEVLSPEASAVVLGGDGH
ncbi:RNA exonuclease [Purpureocillium lavendulum]|uniref:RNA exonuclease n=1 Tax=Purpureocillium lavendulum TaxID=1247861 RepID=A0AB34FQ47_9HYPO|nr:RNA exonuclease [Purpureocillium lavendulum]